MSHSKKATSTTPTETTRPAAVLLAAPMNAREPLGATLSATDILTIRLRISGTAYCLTPGLRI